jgi:hypothetical protein
LLVYGASTVVCFAIFNPARLTTYAALCECGRHSGQDLP